MNTRINNINNMIDNIIKNDTFNNLLKKYKNELEFYEYIDNIDKFSTLSLKGSLRFINKYDKNIRMGGLLIKIYKNNNNNWFGIIKHITGKKYYIAFDKNYIFYLKTKDELFRKSLECFLFNYKDK
jgi:hypothetical protein